ncbi:phosphotransferase family protein [Vibrio sp. WXL103]|uniref:phosphotransferase family protein n=1 Tax=Vibrio sp. WXL103 TaxID=3450710 RepID=UPI003EC4BF9E
MEQLHGGRVNSIYRSGENVIRPSGAWSFSVHQLLKHLRDNGFEAAPKCYGFDSCGNEVLSFVDGEVYNYPLEGNIASNQALVSAAQLLREYHDTTVTLLSSPKFNDMHWQLPSREPIEVICHGDYAPYNVALKGFQTVGVFDFDTAHPASRLWDIAYAVYCWAPFKTNECDRMGDLDSQTDRAKLFCEAYGLSNEQRQNLVVTMIDRVSSLVDFMHQEAERGNDAFVANIRDGHHLAYLADIEYMKSNQGHITNSLLSDEISLGD